MKVDVKDRGCTTSGNELASKRYEILTSAGMFDILSSKMYKDKLLAPIRELGSNCADIHRMNGVEELFEIQLPTLLRPEMSFKDYGGGLSDSDVMGYYTTYGYSTKNDADLTKDGQEITGGFGLGCKSPMAYTDTFTVESRFNGMMTIYAAHLDNEGMPTIVKISSAPTDEKSGLTVKIPIKDEDIQSCQRKLERNLEFYKIQPVVTGGASFKVNAVQYHIDKREKGYALRDCNVPYDNKKGYKIPNTARVIIGEHAVPLNLDLVLDGGATYQDNRKYKSIDFFVPMGSVELAVSREELSYDAKSVQFLRGYLKKIEGYILDDCIVDLKAMKNGYERNIALAVACSVTPIMSENLDHLLTTLNCTDTATLRGFPYKEIKTIWGSDNRFTLSCNSEFYGRFIGYRNGAYFVVVDEKRSCDIKTRQWAGELLEKCRNNPDFATHKVPVIYQIPGDRWPELQRTLGFPSDKWVRYTSKLDYIPPNRVKKEAGIVTVYRPSKRLNEGIIVKVDHHDTLFDGDMKYVVIDSERIIINGKYYNREQVLCVLTKFPDDTYFIFKSSLPTVKDMEWEEGSKELLQSLKESIEHLGERKAASKLEEILGKQSTIEAYYDQVTDKDFTSTYYNKEVAKDTVEAYKVVKRAVTKFSKEGVALNRWAIRYGEFIGTMAYTTCLKVLNENKIKVNKRGSLRDQLALFEKFKVDTIGTEWDTLFPMLKYCGSYNLFKVEIREYISKYIK
tara:strand:- start:10161 stop:12365 length:2205 start_codon:yes stop_codon:yes gene_type:complete